MERSFLILKGFRKAEETNVTEPSCIIVMLIVAVSVAVMRIKIS